MDEQSSKDQRIKVILRELENIRSHIAKLEFYNPLHWTREERQWKIKEEQLLNEIHELSKIPEPYMPSFILINGYRYRVVEWLGDGVKQRGRTTYAVRVEDADGGIKVALSFDRSGPWWFLGSPPRVE